MDAMFPKPKLPANQRRGSVAYGEIVKRLSNFSLRYPPLTDMGIDLICDLLEDDSPTGEYFGVQAKGTKRFGSSCSVSIKKTTISFWLSQPFPVFLVVYNANDGDCYWASIEDHRRTLCEQMRSQTKTVTIRVDKSHILQKDEGKNQEFIEKIEEDRRSNSLVQGYPKWIGKGYVRTIPPLLLSSEVIQRINDNVRLAMLYLINNYSLRNDTQNAYRFCEALTKIDTSHYDPFLILARLNKLLGRPEEADKYFDIAIKMCQDDPNWDRLKPPSAPSIKDIIDLIRQEKQNAKKDREESENEPLATP
jgi:hypothetical protein